MSVELAFRNPEGLAQPPGYSHVVTVRGGTTVYVSGQVAFDAAGMLVGEGDHRRQAEQVFANLQTALAAAGASFEHVVKLTYYVVNLSPEVTQMLRELRTGYVNRPVRRRVPWLQWQPWSTRGCFWRSRRLR